MVVGYDDSEGAGAVVERAVELAETLDARLVVVSVAPSGVATTSGVAIGIEYVPPDPDLEATIRDALEKAVARVAESAERRGVECETRVVTGTPVDGILTVAEEVDADLIVVGHHERGFLERVLEGSVSGSVARRAHCDVLVVHSG
jgi:nucleotide-binding universal stress UspA family protein